MEIHCQYSILNLAFWAPALLTTCNATLLNEVFSALVHMQLHDLHCKTALVKIQKRGPVGKTVCLEDCK